MSKGLFITAQQRSIMVQSAQERAARLLAAELQLLGTPNALYDLPAEQELRLQAVEARFELLQQRLLDQAMAPYLQPAEQPAQPAPAQPAAPAAPQAPAAPASGGVPRL